MTAEEALRYQNYWLGKMPINKTPTGSQTTPISETIGIPIADDTLVHFAPETHNPVYVSGYQSYWVKYANVKDWTPL
jgi:hypothetical protein